MARQLTDQQRRSIAKPILKIEVFGGDTPDKLMINGEDLVMTRSYRVECVRCQQYIGRNCCCKIGYVVYIPELQQRRAICDDCCVTEIIEHDTTKYAIDADGRKVGWAFTAILGSE